MQLKEKLEGLGFDPIAEMVEIAQDPECKPDLKKAICSDLAQYVYPKRKAIEHSGDMSLSIEDYLLDDG